MKKIKCKATRDFVGTKAEGRQVKGNDDGSSAFVPDKTPLQLDEGRHKVLRREGLVTQGSAVKEEKADRSTKEEKGGPDKTK